MSEEQFEAEKAYQVSIVRPGRMHHDALRGDGSARFVAGIIRQKKFMQIHLLSSLFNCSKTVFSFTGIGRPIFDAFSTMLIPSLDK